MNESEKEFLTTLGYFFLQNNKPAKALIIFKALHELFPEDPYMMKAASYASLINGYYEDALLLVDKSIRGMASDREKEAGYLLKSKALWGLGRESEARETLNQYFRLRESQREIQPQ